MAGIGRCKLVDFLSTCFPCMKNYQVPPRKVTLLMVGLDNSGKTATARVVKGESPTDVAPTIGFSRIDFKQGNFDVTIFDVGGGHRIRGIWKNYYAESYGLIFVIDSSDVNRIEETRAAITEVLSHPRMSGKPVLVLANKQDKEGALSEACLIECLSLDKLVNEQKCVCQMKGCSTVLGTGKKIDKSIRRGLFWLLNCIGNDFDGLKARVERDTKAQQVFEEMEKQERAERVRQLRKEREEREKEHATEHPEFAGFDSDIDSDPFIANPFQPINAVLMENERRKRRMDKDIDCIIQRPYTEQEKPDMQSQFNNGSQRTFDDCVCTDPYRVLSYIRPTEKEIDNAQSSECADSDPSEKKTKTFRFIRPNRILPHNVSDPGPEPQDSPSEAHLVPDLSEKKNKTFRFIRPKRILPHNISDPGPEPQDSPSEAHPVPDFCGKSLPPLRDLFRRKPNSDTDDCIS
ncbi:ADP-ribosylation factor-like protein 13B isoform X2 [Sminthopsis crassicaudata]|uniref:ADP-ribosylation factor-like protein 13B isoform X2 n=1 Tax=Sminthopsis crassicaudata TaxID=9301 RepID=UPI003D692482